MRRGVVLASVLVAGGLASAEVLSAESMEALAAKVRARETAFAKTMADRDHAAFATFVAEEALFLGRSVLRGRPAVVEGWKSYFEGDKAPFSWQPDRVEVSGSGDMGMTSGRYVQVITGAEAQQGRYVVVWRRDGGDWKVLTETRIPDPPRAAPARRR